MKLNRIISKSLIFLFSCLFINTNFVKATEIEYNKNPNLNTSNGIVYLSDRAPTGYASYKYDNDIDMKGNKISLLVNGEEKVYEKGIATHSYASVFYTDIQEYGYEKFEAIVGISSSARGKSLENSNYAKVQFKVYADGIEVFSSPEITSQSEGVPVNIDLTGVKVLQLVVDPLGSNYYDHAVWADAKFTTAQEKTPWLEVSDLEFNLPEQVTASNILEYAEAKDYKGNDISDKITYSTNYIEGTTGTYQVKYMITDDEGNYRERAIKMVVTGESYEGELSLERLKKPWASYLYHGRGTLSVQGQRAWDAVLKEILDFDANKWEKVTHWGESCYEISIGLQGLGIYVNKNEISSLQSMFMDDEPRSFILPDWGASISTKDGMADVVTVYARARLAEAQDEWLQKIEKNTVEMLEASKDDMSEAQRVYYVLKNFSSWIEYADGGQLLHEGLGNGRAVCGGNSRSSVYLTQRVGVKSIFARSSVHAWSYTKLYNEDAWYKNDLLAGPAILVDADSSKHNLSHGGSWTNRHYKWFGFNKNDYSRHKLTYPSVWITLISDKIILPKNKPYDLRNLISSFGSIYNEEIQKDQIEITIQKLDESGNVVDGKWIGLEENGDGSQLKAGDYVVNYKLLDSGRIGEAKLKVHVTTGEEKQVLFSDALEYRGFNSIKTLGLYNGTEEVWYNNALVCNEGGYISFNVEGEDYKYISLDFGIRNSVRLNNEYGFYGNVQLEVLADDKVIYQSDIIGWKTPYTSVNLEIPEGTKKITLKNVPRGAGNNHAGIGNLRMIKDSGKIEGIRVLEDISFNDRLEAMAFNTKNELGLYNGTEEVWYNNALVCNEGGYISFNVEEKGYRELLLDFGIRNSVRLNNKYGFYGNVQLEVLADDKVIYQSDIIGWKTPYTSVSLEIPEGTKKITLKNVPRGAGNNHAGIGNLRMSRYN